MIRTHLPFCKALKSTSDSERCPSLLVSETLGNSDLDDAVVCAKPTCVFRVVSDFRRSSPSDQSPLLKVVMDVAPPNPNTFPIHEEESPPSGYAHESGSSPVVQQQDTPQQHELWSKTVTLSRGRAPGDPHARTVNFHCRNVDDLGTYLRDHRATPNPEYPPEHTTVEFIFPISASFLVSNPFGVTQPGPKLAEASKALHSLYGTPNSTM